MMWLRCGFDGAIFAHNQVSQGKGAPGAFPTPLRATDCEAQRPCKPDLPARRRKFRPKSPRPESGERIGSSPPGSVMSRAAFLLVRSRHPSRSAHFRAFVLWFVYGGWRKQPCGNTIKNSSTIIEAPRRSRIMGQLRRGRVFQGLLIRPNAPALRCRPPLLPYAFFRGSSAKQGHNQSCSDPRVSAVEV